MSEDSKKPELEIENIPELEEMASDQVSPQSLGPLFGDESISLMSAKLTALEAYLVLLTRESSFAEFSREVLLVCMRVVKCEAGSFLEFDHTNQRYFFRAVVGQSSDRINGITVPKGKGIVGHVGDSKQPLVVNDAEENKIHLKSIGKAVGFPTRNLVAFPVMIRGRIFGVIEMLNRVGEDEFTAQDVEELTYLAQYAARVIEIKLMINWAIKQSGGGKKIA